MFKKVKTKEKRTSSVIELKIFNIIKIRIVIAIIFELEKFLLNTESLLLKTLKIIDKKILIEFRTTSPISIIKREYENLKNQVVSIKFTTNKIEVLEKPNNKIISKILACTFPIQEFD